MSEEEKNIFTKSYHYITNWLDPIRESQFISQPLVWLQNYPLIIFFELILLLFLIIRTITLIASDINSDFEFMFESLLSSTVVYFVLFKVFSHIKNKNKKKNGFLKNKGKFIEAEQKQIIKYNLILILIPVVVGISHYVIAIQNTKLPPIKEQNNSLIIDFIPGDYYTSIDYTNSTTLYKKVLADSLFTKLDTTKFYSDHSLLIDNLISNFDINNSEEYLDNYSHVLDIERYYSGNDSMSYCDHVAKNRISYNDASINLNKQARADNNVGNILFFCIVNIYLLYFLITQSYSPIEDEENIKKELSVIFIPLCLFLVTVISPILAEILNRIIGLIIPNKILFIEILFNGIAFISLKLFYVSLILLFTYFPYYCFVQLPKMKKQELEKISIPQ